jgi:hypothetical protein
MKSPHTNNKNVKQKVRCVTRMERTGHTGGCTKGEPVVGKLHRSGNHPSPPAAPQVIAPLRNAEVKGCTPHVVRAYFRRQWELHLWTSVKRWRGPSDVCELTAPQRLGSCFCCAQRHVWGPWGAECYLVLPASTRASFRGCSLHTLVLCGLLTEWLSTLMLVSYICSRE